MSNDQSKRIVIALRQAPYGNSLSREAIDIALAAGVFEQNLALVFIGDGVWQLLNDQDSEAAGSKNHQKMLSALPLYDISEIYIDEAALRERSIESHQLSLNGHLLSEAAIIGVFESADVILNF